MVFLKQITIRSYSELWYFN